MDANLYLGITLLAACMPFIYGCSPEHWVEPTLESKSHYAKIIAIGTVKSIIKQDPADMVGETYGAKVQIQCTYKGGILGDMITIAGAGFIHGMCDSKDVEVDKKYILFLDEKTEGQDYYMQSGAAEMSTRDKDLVKQCNLEMRYPQENGITLPRKICLEETSASTCKRYEEPKASSGKKPVVDTGIGAAETTTPGDGAPSMMTSLGLLVTSLMLNFI